MLTQPLLLIISLVYVAILVMIAWLVESRKQRVGSGHAIIYTLTLAVYCSSWTFFGAVGTAANEVWDYVPIFLGPMLLYLLGQPLIQKLVTVGSLQKTTSIADFIGTRYGKRQVLAASIALVAVFGSLPYIALQLKAISMAWDTLSATDVGNSSEIYQVDTTFVIALLLAVFAMLFGTRHIEGRERNSGMMAALAVESLVKLAALMVLGAVAMWVLIRGDGLLVPVEELLKPWAINPLDSRFLTVTVISMLAIICLPRQFHVSVVEYQNQHDTRLARWLFPLYLLLVTLLVLPITLAGQGLFHGSGMASDTYVLQLPLSLGMNNVAVVAFLGGFSAATGMVIVAVITLSIMVSNEVILPMLLRWGQKHGLQQAFYYGRYLKWIRRFCVMGLLLAGWWMNSRFGDKALASIGLISFACFAQLAPALIGAIFWRRGHAYGVYAGLAIGFGAWCYCLLLPATGALDQSLMLNGPWGVDWLRPHGLFGTQFSDPLSHGVFWSLLPNLLLYMLVSTWIKQAGQDRIQANSFVRQAQQRNQQDDFELSSVQIGRLRMLLDSFVDMNQQQALWRHCETRYQQRLMDGDRAPLFVVAEIEAMLSGLVGAASAQRSLKLLEAAEPLQFSHVAEIVGGTSQQLQFNLDLLQVTVETMSQGISVVDAELNMVAWNKRYEELFDYPSRLLYVGCPIASVYRYNAERGMFTDGGTIDEQVEKRLQLLRLGGEHQFERVLPNGTTIQVVGKPMPTGGFVTTYTDVSEFKQLLSSLEKARDTLESRVAERTEELQKTNRALEEENQLRARAEQEIRDVHASKTRFMQATSHDLLQPISAAKLFVSSLKTSRAVLANADLVSQQLGHVEKSLLMAEHLISSLREIARLESGKMVPKIESFPIAPLLEELTAEFSLLASEKQLQLITVSSSVVVSSDRFMLRRILQNFLSNALFYTRRGRVLLGCRRTAAGLRIEIWDTGPGITETAMNRIFQEFERLNPATTSSEKGMGLGLTIAQGMASLLGHEIQVKSNPGRGSVFSVTLPLGNSETAFDNLIVEEVSKAPEFTGVRVVCVDNEPEILQGLQSLLQGWGCEVLLASSQPELTSLMHHTPADMLIFDYHLDQQLDGLELYRTLPELWRQVPLLVISADNSDQIASKVKASGAKFLAKPLDLIELARIMRLMLSEPEI